MVKIPTLSYGFQRVNINYKSPVENLYDTPVDLPTAEPDTPQFSKMLTQDDFTNIILQPPQPFSCVYVAWIWFAGKNTADSSLTVYYKVYKNGTVIFSGSGNVSANNYYTINIRCSDVSVGDVFEVKAWASGSGVNYDYDAYQVVASNFVPLNALNSVCTVIIDSVLQIPVFVKGRPVRTGGYTLDIYHLDKSIMSVSLAPVEISILCPKQVNGLYTFSALSNTSLQFLTGGGRPIYYYTHIPTKIRMYIWKLR